MGGNKTALAIDPQSPMTVYAGAGGGGVFRLVSANIPRATDSQVDSIGGARESAEVCSRPGCRCGWSQPRELNQREGGDRAASRLASGAYDGTVCALPLSQMPKSCISIVVKIEAESIQPWPEAFPERKGGSTISRPSGESLGLAKDRAQR